MKEKLIEMLAKSGMSRKEISDLLLYELVTDDRREEMLSWIEENGNKIDNSQIIEKAIEIAKNYLENLPYSKCNLTQAVPKFTETKIEERPVATKLEDPFDAVLKAFFEKTAF